MSKKKIYKPRPISGFPEWLPEERLIEQQWLDKIRAVYESYGYCNIETPSVEELDVIAAKGEDVDKEIYVLERLHKEEGDKEARLALHFDQTVPLARYTAQHFANLTFPFKRYQMQKVWRGERPQMGRMREFYQCDIDVIGVDNLPIHFDAEVASICYEAIEALDIGRVQLRISNRKILMGFLEGCGITNNLIKQAILSKIDKLEKEALPVLTAQLQRELTSLCEESSIIEEILEHFINFVNLAKVQIHPGVDILGVFQDHPEIDSSNKILREGIDELQFVMDHLKTLDERPHFPAAIADLSIVRGLDYYTGTVYETQLLDVPEFTGSVCSGGRYDDLAGSYINKHLPGVGISIGFSRLFDVLRQSGKINAGKKSPADILMILPSEDARAQASETARTLRSRGYKVESYHNPQKIGKQIGYAEKKGIRYIWFPDADGHSVKDLESGEQTPASADNWEKA